MRTASLTYLPPLVTLTAVFAGWQALVLGGFVNPHLLPPPTGILSEFWKILRHGEIVQPLLQTLSVLAAGYLIGCALGAVLGLAMGISNALFSLFEPIVEMTRTLPKPALLPPLLLFLGFGVTSKVTIVALAALFPVLINALQAVRGIDSTLVDTGRTFGKSRTKIILSIIVPAAAPMIFTGMRVSLGLSLVLVILAEMLVDSQTGVGFLILDMERSFEVQKMYAWIFILCIMGVTLNSLFVSIERRLLPWQGK